MHKSYLIPWLLMASFTIHSTAQAQSEATSIKNISARDGFKVELLYTVPKEKLGSWVNLCVDDKNRIIASDQFGGLYRFPAPETEKNLDQSKIEKFLPIFVRPTDSSGRIRCPLRSRSTITKKDGKRDIQTDRLEWG